MAEGGDKIETNYREVRQVISKHFSIICRTRGGRSNVVTIRRVLDQIFGKQSAVEGYWFNIGDKSSPKDSQMFGAFPFTFGIKKKRTAEWDEIQKLVYQFMVYYLQLYAEYQMEHNYDDAMGTEMTIYLLTQSPAFILSYESETEINIEQGPLPIPHTHDFILSVRSTCEGLACLLTSTVLYAEVDSGPRYTEMSHRIIGPYPEYRNGDICSSTEFNKEGFLHTDERPLCWPTKLQTHVRVSEETNTKRDYDDEDATSSMSRMVTYQEDANVNDGDERKSAAVVALHSTIAVIKESEKQTSDVIECLRSELWEQKQKVKMLETIIDEGKKNEERSKKELRMVKFERSAMSERLVNQEKKAMEMEVLKNAIEDKVFKEKRTTESTAVQTTAQRQTRRYSL